MIKKEPEWIWRQIARLTVLVIGLLPLLFSPLVSFENRAVIIALAGGILIISSLAEIWQPQIAKRKKEVASVIKIQIIFHFLLLTLVLHFFGRINGPLFLLYLPVIMEAFLSKNLVFADLICGAMIFSTSLEYSWLVWQGEKTGFFSLFEYIIRILSLVFMRIYGSLLAKEMIAEEKTLLREKEANEKLDKTKRELKKATVKIEALAGLKDEFIAVASHELRAPMATIKGYLSMILDGDIGKIPVKVKNYLKNAYEGNEQMILLVNNMLSISEIESGKKVMNIADLQIEEIIQTVTENFQKEAQSHGLELKYFPPAKRLPKIRIDSSCLQEILSNLVGNAINFTVTGHVYIGSQLLNGMVVTEIEDTGVGIPKESQKKLFQKFYQLDGDHLKKGSGLGLYLCKMLLNEFSGRIWFKSKFGKGTTFYFSLPAIGHSAQGSFS